MNIMQWDMNHTLFSFHKVLIIKIQCHTFVGEIAPNHLGVQIFISLYIGIYLMDPNFYEYW